MAQREGLPKKGETFLFFRIVKDRIGSFCSNLHELTPLITSAAQVQNDRARIIEEKKKAADGGTHPVILDITGVNIAFSQKGIDAVS